MSSPYAAWNEEQARRLAEAFVSVPGGLLPALHAVQERFGHISEEAIRLLAEVLNLSRAEVHGVVGFYHDFRRSPPGRHVIRVCQAEACQAMGSRELTARVKERLGLEFGQTDDEARFSLEPVYCLGNCACAPSIMVNERVHGRVTPERLDPILGALEESCDG